MASSVIAIIIICIILILRSKLPLFSCRLAMPFAAFLVVAYSTINITHHHYDYNQFSSQTRIIPHDATVFTTLNDNYQKEFLYLHHRVEVISKIKPLPLNTKEIFFMSNEHPPIYAAYQWTNIVKTSTPQGIVTIWRGRKKPEIIKKSDEEMPTSLH
jgi:hypothetical protein